VLFGATNAGKSALFNALAGAERALVSDLAGTTRDEIALDLDLGGARVHFCDGAGLDAGARGADAAAQHAARAARESADLVLWVIDASRQDAGDIADEARELPPGTACIVVASKIDRPDASPARWTALAQSAGHASAATSCVSGSGLDGLRARIALALARRGAAGSPSRDVHARHLAALERCARELDLGLERVRAGASLELLAEHLRDATRALDDITGETTSEAVLDRLFARFCLGK
jgi:tRNA modification GTPase